MNYKLLFLGIFLGIVLSGITYWFYNNVYNSDSSSGGGGVNYNKNYLLDGALTIPISRFKLKNFNANRFCIELWLFVNPNALLAITNEGSLNIFTIGDTNTNTNKVSLNLSNDTTLKIMINGDEYVVTSNFFLQKWEQVIISIDQHLVDLYLDGKLMQSNISSNTITIPTDKDTISFKSYKPYSDIYVSGMNVNTTAMDPKTALNNYNTGKRILNKGTQISIALTKNDNVSKNFVLF
jgi:hypothetical protein